MGVVMHELVLEGERRGLTSNRNTEYEKKKKSGCSKQRCAFVNKERKKERKGKKTWRKLPTCNIQKDEKAEEE